MNRIVDFYESNHLTVLAIVVIVLGFYILSIKNRIRNIDKMNSKNEDNEDNFEILDRKIESHSIVTLKYILTGKVVTCDFTENKSKKYIIPRPNIKRIYFDNPLAVALFDKETGDIIKYKENEIDEKDIYVEVLKVNNTLFTEEEIEFFTKDNSEKTNGLENLTEEEKSTNKSKSMEPQIFEYTKTRLTFKKTIIDEMQDNDILIINVEEAQNEDNNGRFKMTKKQIYNTFNNVINSETYNTGPDYNYKKTPKKAQQFSVVAMPIVKGKTCNTKDDLVKLLKNWLGTNENTIGDLKGKKSNPEPWIRIKIDNDSYQINADSRRVGVQEFLNNEGNKHPWLIIPTKNSGNLTKVTNDINGNPIPFFYMYKS